MTVGCFNRITPKRILWIKRHHPVWVRHRMERLLWLCIEPQQLRTRPAPVAHSHLTGSFRYRRPGFLTNRRHIVCLVSLFSLSFGVVIIAEIVGKSFVASAVLTLSLYLATATSSPSASAIDASCSTLHILPWRKPLSPNNDSTTTYYYYYPPLARLLHLPEETTHNVLHQETTILTMMTKRNKLTFRLYQTSPAAIWLPISPYNLLLLFSGHRQIYILRVVSDRTKPCCLVQFAYLTLNNHTCALLLFLFCIIIHLVLVFLNEAIIWLRE